MTTRVLPDTLKLIRDHLVTVPEVNTFTSTRVYTERPANPQFPAVMLLRAGGIPEWFGDDRARIDVHCYARTDTESKALSRATFKALMEAPQTHATGILTDVKPASDLQELRDPSYIGPGQPMRYVFSVLASTHS